MPNQRRKGKKLLGVWLSPSEIEALKVIAEREGRTMSQILKAKIDAHLQEHKEKEIHSKD